MSEARERILGRIRSATRLRGAPMATAGREESRGGGRPLEDLKSEFASRWRAVGGEFHEVPPGRTLAEVLLALLEPFLGKEICPGRSVEAFAPGMTDRLVSAGHRLCAPDPKQARTAKVGLTVVDLGLAYSGSVLVTSRTPGELTASLLPSVHIAILSAEHLVREISDATSHLGRAGWPRGAALITGPSRTADIELTLVKGVHGPESTHVVFVDGRPAA